MKKLLLILMGISLYTSTSAIPPKWLREALGCVWHWCSESPTVTNNGDGTCSYERDMCGESWLWNCPTQTYSWTSKCDGAVGGAGGFVMPEPEGEIFDKRTRICIAGTFASLQSQGFAINPAWTDPDALKEPGTLMDAVKFRLALAGYTYNTDWESLTQDPCPVPAPTQTVTVPQSGTYINLACSQLSVNPNPTSGLINISLGDFIGSILAVRIIRLEQNQLIYQANSSIPANFSYDMSTQPSGLYVFQVQTTTGLINLNFIKQ